MTPLNEQAYNYLQKLIMENHFSYQEVYSETKLSKELGISRTPLRDAVHRLAQEGYIDIIPSKGFTLHQINVDDVNETLQIRSALESYCTLQIARESDTSRAQSLFAELNELLYKMETVALTSHSIETFCQYDFQFHTKIIDYFDVISTTSEVNNGKNKPDIYLLTAKKLSLDPKNCLVFEDIYEAIIGAKSAGMTVCAIYDKYSDYNKDKITKLSDFYIKDFTEIIPKIV